MREIRAPSARPEFVSDLRDALMAEADTVLKPVNSKLALPSHPRSRRDRRIAVVAGTAALLGATTSVAVAAQGALPGDTLYPVKRAIEGVHTSLTFDDSARAETVLDQATGRLEEIELLARRIDSTKADQLPETLDDFSSQADKAADLMIGEYNDTGRTEPLTELRGFVEDSMKTLINLDALLPSTVTDSLKNAASVLTDIDDRIGELCPQCAGGILELPARLTTALGSAAPGAVVTPTQQQSTSGGDTAPPKSNDPVPTGQEPPADLNPPKIDDPVKKITEEAPTTIKKTTKTVDSTIKKGNKVLLGDGGLLDPVTEPLDPLLGPLLGDGGLLSD